MARHLRRPRKILCTCWFHCLRGRHAWKATYDKHKVEVERCAHINENVLRERHGHDATPLDDVLEVEGIIDSHENREDTITDDEMNEGQENSDVLDDNIARLERSLLLMPIIWKKMD